MAKDVPTIKIMKQPDYDPEWWNPKAPVPFEVEYITYEVKLVGVSRGNAWRRARVATAGGGEPDLNRPDVQAFLDAQPWQLWHQPAILREFERWFDVTAYRATGNVDWLWAEFQMPPYAVDPWFRKTVPKRRYSP